MKTPEYPEFPDAPDERHPITALSQLYLAIGLPLDAAVRSAVADFECLFETPDLCAA